MPLDPRASVESNAREMMRAGHPRAQAFAAAYATKRRGGKGRRSRRARRK